MPFKEIGGRIASELRVKRLQWAANRQITWTSRVEMPPKTVIGRCVELVPGTHPGELATLSDAYPQYVESLKSSSLEYATEIESGRHQLLGKTISITPSIDWSTDPSTGYRWSDDFFKMVGYNKAPEPVDFKNLWEIGRQQYVVELSRSWLLNRVASHGELARDMILSWIDHNPFCRGIHWTSGLEVAMRSISWIWALANLSQFEGWSEQQLQRVVASLGQHASYLENHFSFYSSPYNHVIGEATGLCLISSVLRGGRNASRWRRRAIDVLRDFGPRQFYSDGFCVEQAVGYHYYTLGFLLLAELAIRNDSGSGLDMDELLVGAFRAGTHFRQADGTWPAIGDVDSARSIPVARENYWDFSSLHQVAAHVFDAPEIICQTIAKPDGPASGDDLYWLCGCEGLRRSRTREVGVSNRVTTLLESGYFSAGDGNDHLLFDAGPISHGLHRDATPSAAHGHADTLQVLYQFQGTPILIDSGMPNYAGDRERAFHFRSPRAHNTIELQGVEFVRSRGILDWSNEIATPVLRGINSNHLWVASGVVEWSSARIERHVLAIPGEGLWVADDLQSEDPRTGTWYWHFPKERNLQLNSAEGLIQCDIDNIAMTAVGTQGLKCGQLIKGGNSGWDGWSSPGYGVLESATQLSFQGQVSGSLCVLTHIGRSNRTVDFQIRDETLTLPGKSADASADSQASGGTGVWRISRVVE